MINTKGLAFPKPKDRKRTVVGHGVKYHRDGRGEGQSDEEDYDALPHPAPRRLEHLKFLVKVFAEDGVIDPCCGTGTTLEAAKNAGLSGIGIEIEEKYCEIAAKRLSQEVFQF